MECPRCGNDSWSRLYKIEFRRDNEIERKLICQNCNLIVITREHTKGEALEGSTMHTKRNAIYNYRYRATQGGKMIKTIERIKYVVVYDRKTNQSMQMDASKYKWDIDEYYKGKIHPTNQRLTEE